MKWERWITITVLAGGSLGACGGGDGKCDAELIDRVEAFLEESRACQTDTDCVVVHTYCQELSRSLCHQTQLNREAEQSTTWARLKRELNECAPKECMSCLAQAVPTCTDGFCGGL